MKEQDRIVKGFPTEGDGVATRLNQMFEKGTPAYECLPDVRAIERPILVDFNNVLANNQSKIVPNPYANDFLEKLRRHGDIIIVTSASSYKSVVDILKKGDLWSDDYVLMTRSSWEFMDDYGQGKPESHELVREFEQYRNSVGKPIDVRGFNIENDYGKRVAPIFKKPFDVPLIDNDSYYTTGNPGIFGITVDSWEPSQHLMIAYREATLIEAVEQVGKHYNSIFRE